MEALTFGEHFGCGFYPEINGRVQWPHTLGERTKYHAIRSYFSPYAWSGGDAIEYVTADGSILCGTCAAKEYVVSGLVATGLVVGDVYYDTSCENCGLLIAPQNLCNEHGTDTTEGCLECEIVEENWNA